jgi:hypothetical protein
MSCHIRHVGVCLAGTAANNAGSVRFRQMRS